MSRRPKTKREKQRQVAEKKKQEQRKLELQQARNEAEHERLCEARKQWMTQHGFKGELMVSPLSGIYYRFRWWRMEEFMREYSFHALPLTFMAGREYFQNCIHLKDGAKVQLTQAVIVANVIHLQGMQKGLLTDEPFQCSYQQFFELPIQSVEVIRVKVE